MEVAAVAAPDPWRLGLELMGVAMVEMMLHLLLLE
jgi:hypothetical protein